MAEFRLSPLARQDLDRVFEDSVAGWGLDQAVRYVDHIEATLVRLAAAPYLGAGCGHIRPRYRRCRVGHHLLYYRPAAYGIAVIRILHERMDAPRHL